MAANSHHVGTILIPASFGLSEFGALAEAIEAVTERYPAGAVDAVLVVSRRKT